MTAKTFFGFEALLASELLKMGAQNVQQGTRVVHFTGDKGFMYKANLGLRTALKILKPIGSFRAINEQMLYRGIQSIDWVDFIDSGSTLAIDATLHSDHFRHSQFIAQKCKDAIVDQFRAKSGNRPGVDLLHPDIRIHVHIDREQVTVSLDSSGESLHHRGYRSATNIAPINEVLAAGMLLLSGWEGKSDFLDPMCGSGTILAEAAMIACNIPANINRREFAFEKWADWDSDLFDVVTESLLKRTREFHYQIMGYDKAPSAIMKAADNIQGANLDQWIKLEKLDFFESVKRGDGRLHMLFNPPYGERLEIDAESFYQSIGNTLKRNYPNTDAWFITTNLEALKYVGLKPSRKIKLFNGSLEARLVKYDMYAGSKRLKFQE